MGSTKIQKQDLDMDGLASAIQTLIESGAIEVGGMPTVIKAGVLTFNTTTAGVTQTVTGKGTFYPTSCKRGAVIKLVVDGVTVYDEVNSNDAFQSSFGLYDSEYTNAGSKHGIPVHFSESISVTIKALGSDSGPVYQRYVLYE